MHRLLQPDGNTFTYKIERHSIMTKGKAPLIRYAEATKGSIVAYLLTAKTGPQDCVHLTLGG